MQNKESSIFREYKLMLMEEMNNDTLYIYSWFMYH